MQILRTTILIFRAQLWRTLRARRTLVCGLIAIIPPLLTFLITMFADPEDVQGILFQRVGWIALMEVVVPILSLIAGAAVVSEEIEDRTITYLLTRPIPRPAILLGRWLACFVWIGLLLVTCTFAIAVAARFGSPDSTDPELFGPLVRSLVWAALFGGAVYTSLFAALGTIVRHPMIVGLVYSFAIEGFLSGLPGRAQSLTIKYHLRSFAGGLAPDDWNVVPMFRMTELDPSSEAGTTLAILTLIALFLGSFVLSRRQYVMTSS